MTNTHTAADLRVAPFSFAATEITVEAISANGRALFAQLFGAGAVSVTLPKSRGDDFAAFVAERGLVVA